MLNWIQRFLTAIATHKADASAHHAKTTSFADITDRAGASKLNWTLDKLLKGAGVGANPTEVALPSGATKEFIVPLGYSSPAISTEGDFQRVNMATGSYVHFNFMVPADFSTLTPVKVVGIASAAGNMDWTVTTDFGAEGEVFTTNSDTDTANGVGQTANQILLVDISAAFTGLAAGDVVGVKFATDNDCFYQPVGLVVKYS